jgi:hypothetical protein
MSKNTLCSCGGGDGPYHPLGEGKCFRMEATGKLIPANFRMQVFEDRIEEVCTVNDYTITTWTLMNQRLYSKHENGIWSLPKDKSSVNSIGDDW